MKSLKEIQQMLDESVNTLLAQHKGRVDLIKVESNPDSESIVRTAYVKMSGGCQGCAGAKATLRSIVVDYIFNFDHTIVDIIDATDHSDKTNAFYKKDQDNG